MTTHPLLRILARSRVFWGVAVVALAAAITFSLSSVQAVAAPVPPTRVGINLPPPDFSVEARSFTNLAIYANIIVAPIAGGKWLHLDDGMVGPTGWPSNLPPDSLAMLQMMVPPGARMGTLFHCSWQGQANITAEGNVQIAAADANNLMFYITVDALDSRRGPSAARPAVVRLLIKGVSPANPLTALDCRERDRPRTQVFDPEFVKAISVYRVVRFMDWMRVNNEATVDWSRELGPQRPSNPDSAISLNDMIALSTEAKVDPWFTIPYTASPDYIRRFAQTVHDRLPNRTVYVELGNEMWNQYFPAATRAKNDGLAARLSSDPIEAQLRQYAIRSKTMLDIWTKVYADRPNRLVRILSSQNFNPAVTEKLLTFKDVLQSVDAMATAPYFGSTVYTATERPANIDDAFAQLSKQMDEVLASARAQKAMAARYGKRYIAYESGQHILIKDDVPLLVQLNSDPRMGALYTRYLDAWKRDIGDTIMLYSMLGAPSRFGAWGLEDYLGQPVDQAPKKKAVLEFIARNGRVE